MTLSPGMSTSTGLLGQICAACFNSSGPTRTCVGIEEVLCLLCKAPGAEHDWRGLYTEAKGALNIAEEEKGLKASQKVKGKNNKEMRGKKKKEEININKKLFPLAIAFLQLHR